MPRAQANILVKLFFPFLRTAKLFKISSSISTILCILTLVFLFHTSQSPTLFRTKNSSKNTEDPEQERSKLVLCTSVFASRSLNISIATRFLARNTCMYHTCSFASVLATLHLQISRSHDPQGSSRILGDENKEGNEKKERKVKKLPPCPLFPTSPGFSWHMLVTSRDAHVMRRDVDRHGGERREPRIISSICGVS